MQEQAEEWLQYQKNRVSQSSLSKYQADVFKHIIPNLGECKVIDMKKNQEILEKKLEGYSPKTIAAIVGTFKRIAKFDPKKDNVKTSKHNEDEKLSVIPKEQFQFLMDELKKDITPAKLGILCVIYTGIRIGELCALRWMDVDLINNVIKIDKSIQRISLHSDENKTILKETKVPLRYVPIPTKLLRLLITNQGRPNAYIITGIEKKLEPRSAQNRLNSICKKTGICTKVTYSGLRDYFAINAIAKGVNVVLVADILGVEYVSVEKYIVAAKSMLDIDNEVEKLNWI